MATKKKTAVKKSESGAKIVTDAEGKKIVFPAKGGQLTPWKKGESGNPNGRPRKFTTVLKSQGYKLSEINDTLCVMLSMTAEEIREVAMNPAATVLEKTVSMAIMKGIAKGSMTEIETVISRAFGTPVATNKLTDNEGKSIAPLVVVDGETADALKTIASGGKK